MLKGHIQLQVGVDNLSDSVRQRLLRYVDLFSQVIDTDLQLDMPLQHPAALAVTAAIILQVPPEQKQTLLEIPSVDELLRELDQRLHQENRGLQMLLAASHLQTEMEHPFSQN